jgi:DNA-damage-inducible protein D
MNTELKSFETIKQLTEYGMEYWSARDLQKSLGYEKWDNFSKVIDKAMLACDVAGFDIKEHFPVVRKIVEMPVGEQFVSRGFGFPDVTKTKKIIDYNLSR